MKQQLPPDRGTGPLQQHALVRPQRRAGAADGHLPARRAAADAVPLFAEVMTGFEYAAAVGMLYEGLARGRPEGHPRHPRPLRRAPAQPVGRGRVRPPLRPRDGLVGRGSGVDRVPVLRRGRLHDVRPAPGNLVFLVNRQRVGLLLGRTVGCGLPRPTRCRRGRARPRAPSIWRDTASTASASGVSWGPAIASTSMCVEAEARSPGGCVTSRA